MCLIYVQMYNVLYICLYVFPIFLTNIKEDDINNKYDLNIKYTLVVERLYLYDEINYTYVFFCDYFLFWLSFLVA